jgi:putative transposase
VLTLRGLVTYYVLFFIHLESRQAEVAGLTPHPNEAWKRQVARNVSMVEWGCLDECRYLSHDRDTKFCDSFPRTIKSSGAEPLRLPARRPNLNALPEHWVKSVKD